MAEQRSETNRDRVRRLLWQPLEALGLKRPRRMTLGALEAMQIDLADKLAWMSDDGLDLLADTVERLAGGPLKDEWPSAATVMNFARRIEPQREPEPRIVRSWMGSAAGRAAWNSDHEHGPDLAVELLAHLRRRRLPPTEFDMTTLRQRAADVARDVRLARGRVQRGVATDDDLRMIAARERMRDEARALVSGGEATDAAA